MKQSIFDEKQCESLIFYRTELIKFPFRL